MRHPLRTRPRRQPQQARARATVDALVEATAYILVRHGYDRASTNRIAAKAGVNIASLYQYFPSKEALVAALIDRHLDEIESLLAGELAAAAELGPVELVVRMAKAYFRMHTVDPKLHRAILEQVPHVARLNPIVAFRARVVAQLAALFSARRGELAVTHAPEAAFIVVNVIDACKQSCLVERPERLGDPRFVHEVVRLLERYLAPTR